MPLLFSWEQGHAVQKKASDYGILTFVPDYGKKAKALFAFAFLIAIGAGGLVNDGRSPFFSLLTRASDSADICGLCARFTRKKAYFFLAQIIALFVVSPMGLRS